MTGARESWMAAWPRACSVYGYIPPEEWLALTGNEVTQLIEPILRGVEGGR